MLTFLISILMATTAIADPSLDQLPYFKNKSWGPISLWTTSNGAAVDNKYFSALNSPLLTNEIFMESMTHLVRERIPERVVHAKGAGAFGFFEVTHNVTDICKAKLYSTVGKLTPVAVRFSLATRDKGEPDTSRDARGFSVKFFTEEGNFDIVGQSTPMFFINDPLIFPSMTKVVRRNTETNLKDAKMFWDIVALRPESVFFFMYLFSDFGIPDGFRYMPGFSIHTYKLYNKDGGYFFVRFHFVSDQGIRNIFMDDAAKLAASDPDYAVRDLFNAIANGDFPSWTVKVQVLSPDDVKNCKFNPFDTTKILPLDTYPLRTLGKLVLNINPTNFFADVEQLAFCPSNLVPGILGAPGNMFEARRFSYRDAQIYRLGVNFNKIEVNCPLRTLFSYDRDGKAPVGLNSGEAPNYYPNSYNGPIPYCDDKCPNLIRVEQETSYNFDQAADFYTNVLTKDERRRMIKNIVDSIKLSDKFVQEKLVNIFAEIHPDFGYRVKAGLSRKSDTNPIGFYINGW